MRNPTAVAAMKNKFASARFMRFPLRGYLQSAVKLRDGTHREPAPRKDV